MRNAARAEIRPLTVADVDIVASLHARSWRRAYRGILSDEYLDDDLERERRSVWAVKLSEAGAGPGWLASVDDEFVGFVYVRPHADDRWGTLVDNLHVLARYQGLGIGRCLLHTVGTWTATYAPQHAVHLWVFAENHPAREFYRRMGGAEVEFVDRAASDGRSLPEYRVAWESPEHLMTSTTSR